MSKAKNVKKTGRTALVKRDDTAIERPFGRPTNVSRLFESRPMPDRIRLINEYHGLALDSIARGAVYAVMCGVELCAAKNGVKHGEWEKFVERNCPFSPSTAWRYMEAASRAAKNPNLARMQDLLLRNGGKSEEIRLFQKTLEAELGSTTAHQLYLNLGIIKECARGYEVGGNALLRKWLAEHAPQCTARCEADLPPEIGRAWSDYKANLASSMKQADGTRQGAILQATAYKLVKALERGAHQVSPRCFLEKTCMLVQDVHQALLAELRDRKPMEAIDGEDEP